MLYIFFSYSNVYKCEQVITMYSEIMNKQNKWNEIENKNENIIKHKMLYLWLLEFQQWHWQHVCQRRHCRCTSPHPQLPHYKESECHLLTPPPGAHQISLAHRSCMGSEEKQKYTIIKQWLVLLLFKLQALINTLLKQNILLQMRLMFLQTWTKLCWHFLQMLHMGAEPRCPETPAHYWELCWSSAPLEEESRNTAVPFT